MLKIIAINILFTTNPEINCPANKIIIAFITNKNNPKVRIVTGNPNAKIILEQSL